MFHQRYKSIFNLKSLPFFPCLGGYPRSDLWYVSNLQHISRADEKCLSRLLAYWIARDDSARARGRLTQCVMHANGRVTVKHPHTCQTRVAANRIAAHANQISHTPPFLIFIFRSLGAGKNSGCLVHGVILYYLRIALARITNAGVESKKRTCMHRIAGSVPLSCRAHSPSGARETQAPRSHACTDLSNIAASCLIFALLSETHVSNF